MIVRGVRSSGDHAVRRVDAPGRRRSVERAGIVTAARPVQRYLAAIGAGGARGTTGTEGSQLPPVYPALWETALSLDLLGRDGIPFPSGGLVHLGGETVQVRPIHVGDEVRCRVEVDRVEPGPGGHKLTLRCRNWTAGGMLCGEDVIELLIRERGRVAPGRGGAKRNGSEVVDDPERWTLLEDWSLEASSGRRYARASGDYNPIHLWSATARPFGFQRQVLQGFCTEAMIAHALIRGRLGNDPGALRRIRVAFRAPVELPGRVRLLVADRPGGGEFRLEREGARRPAAEGEWTGGAPATDGAHG